MQFEARRDALRGRLADCITKGNLDGAIDTLACLEEVENHTLGERLIVENLMTRKQIQEDTCSAHDAFLCPICFRIDEQPSIDYPEEDRS